MSYHISGSMPVLFDRLRSGFHFRHYLAVKVRASLGPTSPEAKVIVSHPLTAVKCLLAPFSDSLRRGTRSRSGELACGEPTPPVHHGARRVSPDPAGRIRHMAHPHGAPRPAAARSLATTSVESSQSGKCVKSGNDAVESATARAVQPGPLRASPGRHTPNRLRAGAPAPDATPWCPSVRSTVPGRWQWHRPPRWDWWQR